MGGAYPAILRCRCIEGLKAGHVHLRLVVRSWAQGEALSCTAKGYPRFARLRCGLWRPSQGCDKLSVAIAIIVFLYDRTGEQANPPDYLQQGRLCEQRLFLYIGKLAKLAGENQSDDEMAVNCCAVMLLTQSGG